MAKKVQVDPGNLANLIKAHEDASKKLFESWFTGSDSLPKTAFGNVKGADAAYDGYVKMLGALESAATAYITVNNDDIEFVSQMVGAYAAVDHQGADNLAAVAYAPGNPEAPGGAGGAAPEHGKG